MLPLRESQKLELIKLLEAAQRGDADLPELALQAITWLRYLVPFDAEATSLAITLATFALEDSVPSRESLQATISRLIELRIYGVSKKRSNTTTKENDDGSTE